MSRRYASASDAEGPMPLAIPSRQWAPAQSILTNMADDLRIFDINEYSNTYFWDICDESMFLYICYVFTGRNLT